MAAIIQMTFSNAFSRTKMYEFRLKISLKFVLTVRNNNIPALVKIMAWRLPGDKPLSEPMMVSLLTHIYASLGLNDLRQKQHHIRLLSLEPFGKLLTYLPLKCRIYALVNWVSIPLVQIMDYRLFRATPLSELYLVYCQLDPQEQSSAKYLSKYKTFHSRKCI